MNSCLLFPVNLSRSGNTLASDDPAKNEQGLVAAGHTSLTSITSSSSSEAKAKVKPRPCQESNLVRVGKAEDRAVGVIIPPLPEEVFV